MSNLKNINLLSVKGTDVKLNFEMIKKLFFIGILIASTMFASAQCVEVKGVETQKIDNGKNSQENGFEFKNLNDYPVTIEAELRRTPMTGGEGERVSYVTLDAKTFVIDAKGAYTWEVPIKYVYATYVVFKVFKCQ